MDAGLTGAELASQCGWHKSKSSRIENARTPPSDADIRAWCRICGADDQADDIISMSRNAESLYVEWKRRKRAGLRRLQESYVPLHERTRLFRFYASSLVPGFLQTPAYATAVLSSFADFWEANDDVQEAVEARMKRAGILHRGDHRFVMVIEESVLRNRMGNNQTMAGQLGHLLAVISLPNVSLGVIPFSTQRSIWPLESCTIYDDSLVRIELTTAELTVQAPTEVAAYLKAFDHFHKLAVYGPKARALITSAIEALE